MNTHMLTLGQAAKQVSCSKATLSKALNKGDISAKRHDDGSWQIDPAELVRWNETRSQRNTKNQTKTPVDEQVNTLKNSALNTELEALRKEKIERLEAEIERITKDRDEMVKDLREQRDMWQDEAKGWRKHAEQLQITDQSQDKDAETKPVTEAQTTAPQEPVKSSWIKLPWSRAKTA